MINDPREQVEELKRAGFTHTALTNALIQAHTTMRAHLDALQQQFPALKQHPEMQSLEEAIKNYDSLIELYRDK